LRIAVLYTGDRGLARGGRLDRIAVQEAREAADEVLGACADLGHEPIAIAAPSEAQALLGALSDARADLVFHLVESIRGETRFEAAVAWLFEWAGVVYTGSPPTALSLALDKSLARAVLRDAGVPIAPGRVLSRGDEPLDGLRPPWIVKPAREDASHGIDARSVVHGEAALRSRAARVIERYAQPALVEEFVDGREFNVGVLGEGDEVETLPLSEIDFTEFPAGKPRIITFRAKWIEESAEWAGARVVPATDLTDELAKALAETAVAAYRALGLRDYGRVDLRWSERHGPIVVDVNPNPDLARECGLARAAARKGMSYVDLIGRILECAQARLGGVPAAAARAR
jgi:D-alanine-D-alanine ligase